MTREVRKQSAIRCARDQRKRAEINLRIVKERQGKEGALDGCDDMYEKHHMSLCGGTVDKV
jgi:hypothetical protein